MSFVSLPFLLFLIAVFLLFNLAPVRGRWVVLLIASYLFYASLKAPYLLLTLAAVTLISYACGLLLNRAESARGKLAWTWAGIAANFSLLCWLKYLPFLTGNLNGLLRYLSVGSQFPTPRYLVALGVSYYVFQGTSYIADIYLGVLEPERHFGRFALSICFFPKLLQGPIERSGALLSQLRTLRTASVDCLLSGVSLFLAGAFKKVVIADRLSSFVDPVFNHVHQHFGLSLIVATYLFAFQLYFDFSGYTDMALGIGRLFNIRLTPNFNAPYLATSTAEFWRRWHISFSSWILEYIFTPLQFTFRQWRRWGVPLALMLTFFVSGLWHGASWCFVLWGCIHGVYLAVGVSLKKPVLKLYKKLGLHGTAFLRYWQQLITFHLVCFSWIFFRAATFEDAVYVVRSSIFDLPRSLRLATGAPNTFVSYATSGKSPGEVAFVGALLLVAAVIGFLDRKAKAAQPEGVGGLSLETAPWWASAMTCGVLAYAIVLCGVTAKGFIYQQF